ncbi:DinB family protein [Lutibacter sp. Hel_I_33_5]|uniref:DinB family protein n=1 Tax=Lutibacter sp. Hel_I_33_5 TaxID=1566289 RepID=UPI00119CF526|nr:DinB family protein [Lutibacter sp. Hel_I_33_5]TVZ55682.1 DinB family protein [Lutibacter sp. Hel_I_33_5]
MIINSNQLLSELNALVSSHIEEAKLFLTVTDDKLQNKINPESWSVIECIEHLNLYAVFYNTEINKCLNNSTKVSEPNFKSGFLGNKFALDMLPKEGMKTMKTFKSKNPIHSKLDTKKVLTTFITYQEELLDLLEIAKDKNLTKNKTKITLPLLTFRLGDTFRFVIYHNQRHIVQAKRVLDSL